MKIRADKNRRNAAFFSADAKCKVPVGEPDFPISSVTPGKSVIVGSKETFMVGDMISPSSHSYLIHNFYINFPNLMTGREAQN